MTHQKCVRLVKGPYEPYQVLPRATGPLTPLQSITEVTDQQVAKMSKSHDLV